MPKKGRRLDCKNAKCSNLTRIPFPLCFHCSESRDYKCLRCRVSDTTPKYPICDICSNSVIKNYQCEDCKYYYFDDENMFRMCHSCDINGYERLINSYYTF